MLAASVTLPGATGALYTQQYFPNYTPEITEIQRPRAETGAGLLSLLVGSR